MKEPVKETMAVVVNDNGRVQASFGGDFAREDAEGFVQDCVKGGVNHLKGATVITGKDAKKALENGRI